MKKHEHSSLFNKPLDVNHPMYNDVKSEYTTLSMMELHFKIGQKYTNTNQIATEFRNMIMWKFKMAMDNPAEYPQIQDFLSKFDQGFSGLENLSLVKTHHGQEYH